MVGKFIGLRKIKEVKDENDKASLVIFEDGRKEIFSKLLLPTLVSEEAYDLSSLRDKRVNAIAEQVLIILRDYNCKLGELEYLFGKIQLSVEQNYMKAENILFGIDSKGMMDLDKVLLSTEEKKTLDDVLNGGV